MVSLRDIHIKYICSHCARKFKKPPISGICPVCHKSFGRESSLPVQESPLNRILRIKRKERRISND